MWSVTGVSRDQGQAGQAALDAELWSDDLIQKL